MSDNCDMCEGNRITRKAVWFHKKRYAEKLCDKCYKSLVKFYSEFKKKEAGE